MDKRYFPYLTPITLTAIVLGLGYTVLNRESESLLTSPKKEINLESNSPRRNDPTFFPPIVKRKDLETLTNETQEDPKQIEERYDWNKSIGEYLRQEWFEGDNFYRTSDKQARGAIRLFEDLEGGLITQSDKLKLSKRREGNRHYLDLEIDGKKVEYQILTDGENNIGLITGTTDKEMFELSKFGIREDSTMVSCYRQDESVNIGTPVWELDNSLTQNTKVQKDSLKYLSDLHIDDRLK